MISLNQEKKTTDFSMYRTSVLNLQHDISHAVITIIMSDFLDDFPNVSVQVINLGGTIPFILERLQQVNKSPDARDKGAFERKVKEDLC